MVALGMLVTGLALVWVSYWVEQNHYRIWCEYNDNYKKRTSAFADWLNRPNYVLYRFQVYIMWPLFLAVGVATSVVAVLWFVL